MTRPKILIVDDNQVNRSLLEHLLGPYGDCFFAANGKDALLSFEDHHQQGKPLDLIFMDIMMPVLSGIDAVRAIREWEHQEKTQKEVEIVIISALKEGEDKKSAQEAGAKHYLVKPFKEQVIYNLLSQLGYLSPKKA
ncbi:MAG: hypothetical protein A2600_10430 [Candidatus Lambdaproteobacteria bacterium RIFOXYD1_FULL_56_27]|uniref:Response regulatory domain-containing protein n=1 Tax=Candidatus Lambdaproteobacteria bacterium RIFOXYD2_FULL_56_26 TaxID=1817773 RepID=A0A1F6GQD3_9PROT|nr:MAG: hypothetical protein A2557_09255 [Candidatus Lambdaproteobacteria bacterium RIFOXYD2_FULL_56_26]OGH04119.1 MAG: hypothetical protein A2426_02645 [Candidatus Lambdaproteobacteria bacterium RIFOXYC1_FULL_56_13]OGH06364.1 MAG: hypothetical protein A2600_10430 [Candidatus Lambdaproteobacteria bacterium RIFOXYD1_FULL_56_27]